MGNTELRTSYISNSLLSSAMVLTMEVACLETVVTFCIEMGLKLLFFYIFRE